MALGAGQARRIVFVELNIAHGGALLLSRGAADGRRGKGEMPGGTASALPTPPQAGSRSLWRSHSSERDLVIHVVGTLRIAGNGAADDDESGDVDLRQMCGARNCLP